MSRLPLASASLPSGQNSPRFPIEITVIDKNPLIVDALKNLFRNDARFEMVASATDGARLFDFLGQLKPDIVISSWVMPYCNGRELLTRLKDMPSAPRVVIYTGSDNASVAREALRLGAAGFCAKNEPAERLLDVLEAVARGSMIFPFMDINRLANDPVEELTRREAELLKHISRGRTNNEIAALVGISPNTVKFHLRNLYQKLNVRNRAEAAALHASVAR